MSILFYLLVGLCIGIVGGLVGIGGGVLLIPALTMLFNIDPRKAAGISLAVLSVPVALPGAWQYYNRGVLERRELEMAALLAVAFAVGIFLGASIQHRVNLHVLRLIFGLILLFLSVRLLAYSSPEVYHTVGGLGAVFIGWLSFLALRALGRKHLAQPQLANEIRRHARDTSATDEYYI